MFTRGSAHTGGLDTCFWLIEKRGEERTETLTIRLDGAQEALPVFSFPDEARLFVSLGGFEKSGWRVVESTSSALLLALANGAQRVEYVALDPLPEMMDLIFGTSISLVILSRWRFVHSLVGDRRSAVSG